MGESRLKVGDLRERLAHLDSDAIVAVQLRHRGQRVWFEDDGGPDLALVTCVAGVAPSDTVAEPVGTDPVSESTVAVVVLDVWMGGKADPDNG